MKLRLVGVSLKNDIKKTYYEKDRIFFSIVTITTEIKQLIGSNE